MTAHKPKDQILIRMYLVLVFLSILPVLILITIGRIHLVQREALLLSGENQSSGQISIPARRGAILDRAGRTLAVNTTSYTLAVDPTIEGFQAEQAAFFDKLSKLLRKKPSELRQKVLSTKSPQYVVLAHGLMEEEKDEIASWNIPGVQLEEHFKRRYNYGQTAAHILGHVSTDGQGVAGLELLFNDILKGIPGQRAVYRDRKRQLRPVVDDSTETAPKDGTTLVLTIDLLRQTILEEELARGVKETGAKWGTAIAVDPHTGAILAMANVPTYNPNPGYRKPTGALRNHAITDRIEPGSTFKLISASAALENGVIEMDDPVHTGNGTAVFHGRRMTDSHAIGTVPFAEVIVQSSNVGMAKVATRMKPGQLYQYARNFGFGQLTLVDMPGEVSGTLRRTSRWDKTTLTSMSIGYAIDATPLQILMAYATLANGGVLHQPYVVAEHRDLTGRKVWDIDEDPMHPSSLRRVIQPETAKKLSPAFERVVQEGTAKNAQVEGLRIAGKTGTARKTKGKSYASGAYRGTFVGFFPVDNPQVAMIVVMDEPSNRYYGGTVSAPVFQRIASRWIFTFPSVTEEVAPSGAFAKVQAKPVPSVVGLPVAAATRKLRAEGYQVAPLDTPKAPVFRQVPEGGTLWRPGQPVSLFVADMEVARPDTMPDLTGMGVREAVLWLKRHGVEVRVQGSGQITKQQPAPGDTLASSAILTASTVAIVENKAKGKQP